MLSPLSCERRPVASRHDTLRLPASGTSVRTARDPCLLRWSRQKLDPNWTPTRSSAACPKTQNHGTCSHFVRGERWGSNPRPPGPQPGALPTELRPPRVRGPEFSGRASRRTRLPSAASGAQLTFREREALTRREARRARGDLRHAANSPAGSSPSSDASWTPSASGSASAPFAAAGCAETGGAGVDADGDAASASLAAARTASVTSSLSRSAVRQPRPIGELIERQVRTLEDRDLRLLRTPLAFAELDHLVAHPRLDDRHQFRFCEVETRVVVREVP